MLELPAYVATMLVWVLWHGQLREGPLQSALSC